MHCQFVSPELVILFLVQDCSWFVTLWVLVFVPMQTYSDYSNGAENIVYSDGRVTRSSSFTNPGFKKISCLTTYIWSIIFWYNTYSRQHRVKAQSEYTLSFFYIIIFQWWQSLKTWSSTPEGDRRMCPLAFWYGNACSVTFIWSIFGYKPYFWQRRGLKWIYFPVFAHYNISMMAIFGMREIDICAHWLFCTELVAQRLLLTAFLGVTRIFSSVKGQSEYTLPFL